jgi:hypothetical protein
LLLLQVNLYPEHGLLGLGWLSGSTDRVVSGGTTRDIMTLLIGLFIWIRALRIPLNVGDTELIKRQFQVGILIMAFLVLATLRIQVGLTDMVVAYFGLAMVAIALTRMEEVAQTDPGSAAPLDIKWVVTLLGTLFLVGGFMWLTTQVVTVETVRWLLGPVGILVRLLLTAVVILAVAALSQLWPIIERLIGDRAANGLQDLAEGLDQFAFDLQTEPATQSPWGERLFEALQILFVAVLFLFTLWMLVRSFRRWRRHRYATPGGVRESVASTGNVTQDLRDYLRHLQSSFDLNRILRRWNTGSARAIYANLLALMADTEQARQPNQTPYEYEPVAGEALPTRETDVEAITEAYVRAHYGELEVSPEELAELKEAWNRIKTTSRFVRHRERQERFER